MFTLISCPTCSNKFTVPESAMGKRQNCPSCQSTFVAGKSVAETPAEVAMKQQAAVGGGAGMNKTLLGETEPPIKFNCPRCKKPLEAPASEALMKKPCPECGGRLQVPAAPAQAAGAAQPNLNKTLLASDESKPVAPPIRYNCPACKKPLESPAAEAGMKKPCPMCGQRFQIPAASTAGAGQPNLNKTMLVGEDGKPQPAAYQSSQPTSAAPQPAAPAASAAAPAAQTTPGSVSVSKSSLLVGGGILAIGLIFLILIACVVSIFLGSSDRAALAQKQKEIDDLKIKLAQDQERIEKRLADDKRERDAEAARLRDRELLIASIKGSRERADAEEKHKLDREEYDRRKQESDRAHEREMAKIRADSAAATAAAAAAAAARPAYYHPSYYYRGYWYPY